MFFRSLIQATLSTHTGCTAKIAAANHAPGTASRTKSRQASTAVAACISQFTTW